MQGIIHFLGLPTRSAVASMSATVFMSLGWTLPGGDAFVGYVLKLQEQVDQRHRINEPGSSPAESFSSSCSPGLCESTSPLRQSSAVLPMSYRAYVMPLNNSGCSCNSFSRVVERAGLPAVLFTIHFGGFKNIVVTATPISRDHSAANLALRSRIRSLQVASSSTSAINHDVFCTQTQDCRVPNAIARPS